VSQEVFGHDEMTPVDTVLENRRRIKEQTRNANSYLVHQLEDEMDRLDADSDDYQENMERICNRIAELEDDEDDNADVIVDRARDALHFFGVPETTFDTPTLQLSGGIRKKISLACALVEKPQLLLLDEPTCHIDVGGILQLRQLIADCVDSNTTVVLVSHDVDLMNDVATDVIDFRDGKLGYYTGNYRDYLKYRREKISHQLKQANAIEKQRSSMMSSIDTMKKKSTQVDSSQASKKLDKAVKSKVKKLERHGVEKNEKGHYRVAQTDGGMRKGSINAIGASERNTLTHRELIKLAEVAIGPVPDKAVQFDFRDTTSSWGDEPLVMVMDVGHSYNTETISGSTSNLIFDCVDLAIREGSRTTILGENGAGKSTLLSIIAREIMPSVGTVHFANGLNIGYFHQHAVDHLFANLCGRSTRNDTVTPLSFLTEKFPSKTEHEVRGELTRFGLSPKQAGTNVRFLSGGERCRMCMANMMLEAPQLLVLDEISNHLDVESVEALIYGLNKWNGTIVLASHDANLVRSIGGESYVLFDGMLRRIDGGIDTYLKVFAKYYHK
jgi:ATP-binding cassette subfamily F protein 3